MKLILDFVPNQTSRSHAWFNGSKRSRDDDNDFRDFYVWGYDSRHLPPKDAV